MLACSRCFSEPQLNRSSFLLAATRPVTLGNTPLEAVYIPVGLTARQIVGAYLPAQWEDFVEEWGLSLKPPYVVIEHIGGPGDKGRDVIARLQDDLVAGQWDNYQCKHYDRPLMPSDIWGELAKLCFFTWNGTYPLPRRYRFVAPHDVGPKLQLLLTKPADLRREFIASWPSEGMKDLGAQLVKLEGDLRIYIEAFDFSIVGYQPVSEVLEQHRKTPHWHERFKQALPPRPAPGALPDRPMAAESNYLAQLLRAYGHASGRDLTWSEVEGMQKFSAHLKRSRRAFFRAEELYRFSRELFPTGVFDRFKRQIHEGIIDVVDATHANGYECVVAATAAAQNLQLGNCELAPIVEVGDRHGACHHLANDGTITWVKS
jgi:hypothetical protein